MDNPRVARSLQHLSVCHVNCQSLLAHIDEFRLHFQDSPYHLICLTETWLKPEFLDDMVSLQDFTLLRGDRLGKPGGGIGLFVRRGIRASVLSSSPGEYCRMPEYLLVEIRVPGAAALLLGIVYRPPKLGHLQIFENCFVEFLPDFRHALILGDFNADMNAISFDSEHLREFIVGNNLYLVPHGCTHHTATSSTRLDLCIADDESKILARDQHPVPFLSAHDLISVVYDVVAPVRVPTSFSCRSFRGLDAAALHRDLAAVDWELFRRQGSVDGMVAFLSDAVVRVFDVHAPMKRVSIKRRPAPWLTVELIEKIRRRDRLRSALAKTRLPHLRPRFIALRNEVKADLKAARDSYYQDFFRSEVSNPAMVWSKLREVGLLPSGRTEAVPAFSLDELNRQFLLAGQALSLPGDFNIAAVDTADAFTFRAVSQEEVEAALVAMTSNASGLDGLSTRMLRLAWPIIGCFICEIFNLSLSLSVFPSEWRRALVCPIPKKSAPSSPADYRPISLLCVLSKVLERLVSQQVSAFLDARGLRDPFQSAFRKYHSTQSALLRLVDDIRLAVDERCVTVMLLFDFSKAFDCVRHDLLLLALAELNFSVSAVRWFQSYLCGRSQVVYGRDGGRSSWGNLCSGVPQGSVLGPLLFTLFLSDFGSVLTHCRYSFYADDLQIYLSCSPADIEAGIAQVNADVVAICEWALSRGLRLNSAKTRAIIFGSARYVNGLRAGVLSPLCVGAEIIPLQDSVVCLGVVLASALSWREQVLRVSRRVNGVVSRLKTCRDRLPRAVRVMLVRSLVLPLIDYCCLLLTDISAELDLKLQRALNRGVRFIFDARRDEHVTPLYAELEWLKVAERRLYFLGSLVAVVRSRGAPEHLFNRISQPALPPVRDTRHQPHALDATIPRFRTECYRGSFSVSACSLWNSLPPDLRSLEPAGFKNAFRERLLDGWRP